MSIDVAQRLSEAGFDDFYIDYDAGIAYVLLKPMEIAPGDIVRVKKTKTEPAQVLATFGFYAVLPSPNKRGFTVYHMTALERCSSR